MRLIDADKLIEVFSEKKEVWRGNGVLPSNESLMWLAAMGITSNAPTVDAVPLDKLCEWLSENSSIIPCSSCANFVNEYCTAIGDASKPCPKTANDWREAITKWMEEQDD